jgi:hypothetical protein
VDRPVLEPDSPAARLRLAFELSAVADAMRAQRFRRDNPSLDEGQIEALMEAWRGTRPGAEAGDAEGRPPRHR